MILATMIMKVLFGKKLGMTQIFDSEGLAKGATAIEVWPSTVLRLRTKDKDGYEAVQVGAGKRRNVGKTVLGQTGGEPYAVVREIPQTKESLSLGTTLGLDQFSAGDLVKVTAVSKGKGFAGTVKRHNFSRGPKTHGSRNYRQPGSIGGTGAARVFPGQKMPGRMGHATVAVKNVTVLAVHPDDQVILLGGGVPGPKGSVVKLEAS